MNAPDNTPARDRLSLGHPIVDGDGHLVESMPIFLSYLSRTAGDAVATEYEQSIAQRPLFSTGDASRAEQSSPWWPLPNDAASLAMAMAPKLLAQRLPEIGIDFAVLYPSMGLALPTIPDEKLRRAAIRALNTMNSELSADVSDRLCVASIIPMHTPEEAIEELEHCVAELGLKVAMIPPGIARPVAAHEGAFPAASTVDRYGLDSRYDYDPFWRACSELGIAVTSHGSAGLTYLESGRKSPTNYMYNHIGAHAFQQCEFAKTLVMGGVTSRFPSLRFGFLECGALWAVDLLHSLEEHWEKRNLEGLERLDPSKLDRDLLARLLQENGLTGALEPTATGREPIAGLALDHPDTRPAWARDEFEDAQISVEEDFARIFAEQFFLGCEADDPGVYHALHGTGNPFSLKLNAFFSSDIGHWDVPDVTAVVPESRVLVEKGLLDEADYRDFAFMNAVRLYAGARTDFFDGTAVETEARAALAGLSGSMVP